MVCVLEVEMLLGERLVSSGVRLLIGELCQLGALEHSGKMSS